MTDFLAKLAEINDLINTFVWVKIGLFLLIGTGILMTVLTKFFQITHIRHWISRTPIIVRNPACGPSRAESSIPPQRCPEDPVPGMVKLIICAAKTNAPITPMTGIFFGSSSCFTL